MYIRFLVILSLLFKTSCFVIAQNVPVEVVRSDDKVVIENKVYYIHVVRQGQTLYSISRAYNVSQKDIILENPGAQIGLQTGQALKIPFMPESREEETLSESSGHEYILHTIEQGQTLFYLSRTYDVEMDEIIRLNPGVEDGLQVNQVVRVPSRKVQIEREGFPTEDERYIHHKVEQGETLFSLSRKYGVPMREIRRANERVIWGLRHGEYIRIPREVEEEAVAERPAFEKPLPDGEPEFEEFVPMECADFDYREYNRPFTVAMMLPLFIDRNYPVEVIDSTGEPGFHPDHVRTTDELYHQTVPFLEFYSGARMAADSLRKAGIDVVLNIYDTQRNTQTVRSILEKPEMMNADLVIGPVYPENIRIVGEWARRNRVHVVSPMTTRSELLQGNPYIFQVTPSAAVELEQASIFISNFPSSNFVLIHKNDPFENNMVETFKKNIFRNFSYSSDFDNVIFKEIMFTNPAVNIEQSLVKGEKNIVIVPSADQAFVMDVLIRLNVLSINYDITIFGLNDWQGFANLEVEYLHNMELHFASPFFIDYTDRNVRGFLRRYRAEYKTEPSHYGFQGYDIMFYFLQAMKNFGPRFHECLPVMQTQLLQSDFLFRKSDPENGFENNGISIVKYDRNMTIRRLGLVPEQQQSLLVP